MVDRFVTVPDSLELPAAVKVPSARLSDAGTAGRAILDAETAADGRTALGLGTAATTDATDYEARSEALARLDVSRLRARHAATYQSTPTYDGSGQAVHPDVVILAEPWNGYRYWMAMTPYPFTDGQFEYPSILASTDGATWVVPAGLSNPIDTHTSILADPCLIMDGGLLRCIYSGTYSKSSTNGTAWSARQMLTFSATPGGNQLSPSVVKQGSTFHYWCVDSAATPNTFLHATGASALAYGGLTACALVGGPVGRDIWHASVRAIRGGFVGAFTYCNTGTSGSAAAVHLGTSPDGVTWNVGVSPLLAPEVAYPWADGSVYRSCLVPTDGTSGIWGQLWYSAYSFSTNEWHIGYTDLRDPGAEMQVAAKGDLLVGTAAECLSRVAVGANGTIITADATQAAGMKWANTAALTAPTFVPAVPTATFGADLTPAGGLTDWTLAGGASWSTPNLTIPSGGSASCTVAGVVAGTTYQIDVTRSASSGGNMAVTLGAATISLASNYNNRVTLIATATGNLTLTVGGGTWVATVQGISCKAVTAMPSPSMTAGNLTTRTPGNNTAIGYESLSNATTATATTGIGYHAQKALTTGVGDTAIGFRAQAAMTTASSNTAIGYEAQAALQVGSFNTAVGSSAQSSATSADSNTAIGTNAQKSLTTGSGNVAVGHSAQSSITDGSYSTAVGFLASTGASSFSATALGFSATATHANSVALGASVSTTAADQVGVGPRHFELTEVADPAAPATNQARLYTRDNGSGKTQLCVRFATGAVQVVATEP